MIYSPFDFTPPQIAAIVAALLLVLVVGFFICYLITRLRFAYFHCLIHNTTEIRPGWFIYRDQAMRFFWLNVGVGLCFLLLVLSIVVSFGSRIWRVLRETPPGSHPDWGQLAALILPLIPIFLLLALAGVLADVVLRDWMLPHYALDDANAGEAWAQVWAHIKADTRQFAVYALLRVILPTIAMIAVFVVLMIPGLVLVAAVAVLEYGIHSAFADTTGASAVAGILLQVFFGVIAFAFALLASICIGGPVSTAIREYALVFYGGRYQALGNILYPPQHQPLT
jgi:hypothetical protein